MIAVKHHRYDLIFAVCIQWNFGYEWPKLNIWEDYLLKASLATHFPAGGKSHKTMLFAVRDAKRERMKEILQHYMGTICDITFKSIYIFLDESIFIKCIFYVVLLSKHFVWNLLKGFLVGKIIVLHMHDKISFCKRFCVVLF